MVDAKYIAARVSAAKQYYADRDRNHRDVIAIRRGDYDSVAPGLFNTEAFPRPLVANLIDTTARDVSEVMAPLPSFNCQALSLASGRDNDRADRREAIANAYVQGSNLQAQMYHGTDRWASFGFMAYIVEPDFEEQSPSIRIGDNHSAYYVRDHRGRVAQYMEPYKIRADELAADYPELGLETIFRNKFGGEWYCKDVEVCRWRDRTHDALVLLDPELVLSNVEHRLGRSGVHVVERPDITGCGPSGQFDDVIWVQIARAYVQMQTMNAIDRSVNAPLVAPKDIQEIPIGPFSVIQSDNPQNIGTVPLQISPGLFPEAQMLQAEQLQGSRYPEGRSGSIDASIITGQGVQALMGTFNTQVATFQTLNSLALTEVIRDCFHMDETYWPNVKKTRFIKDNGAPRKIEYTPAKDIDGNHMVDVTYGAIAGLDPNRALVFLLQGLAGGLLAKSTARKYLPVDLNVVAEERQIQLEQMDDAAHAAITQLPLAIPQMAMSGADPRELALQVAQLRDLVQKGKSPAEAIEIVFAPKEPPQEAAPAEDPLAALMGGGGGGAPQLPGQGMGGASDLLMGLAGLTPGGSPNLQSTVSTRRAI